LLALDEDAREIERLWLEDGLVRPATLFLPLLASDGRMLGVLVVRQRLPGSRADVEGVGTMQMLAYRLSAVIDAAQARQRLQLSLGALLAVQDAGHLLASSLSQAGVAERFQEVLERIPSAQAMVVKLREDGRQPPNLWALGSKAVLKRTSRSQARAKAQRRVLADGLPGLDGLETTRQIKAELPQTSIVMLTMHENVDYLREALDAGADGYVLKGASRSEIVQAIHEVLRGQQALGSQLTAELLQQMRSTGKKRRVVLTERQEQVLRLLVQGRTNPEIATALGLALGTAKVHVEHLLAKLGVADRTQAAVRATELGLLEPAPRTAR
jgi:DNA-binding NarL/FixJ family response regulator